MARLHNISVFAAVVLISEIITISLTPTAANSWLGTPAPLPEPRPGYFKFLQQCVQKTPSKCAKEIFAAIFITGTVSDECCVDLVLIGNTCHDEIVSYIAHGPDFKAHLSEYLTKSRQVYSKCASGVDPPYAP